MDLAVRAAFSILIVAELILLSAVSATSSYNQVSYLNKTEQSKTPPCSLEVPRGSETPDLNNSLRHSCMTPAEGQDPGQRQRTLVLRAQQAARAPTHLLPFPES